MIDRRIFLSTGAAALGTAALWTTFGGSRALAEQHEAAGDAAASGDTPADGAARADGGIVEMALGSADAPVTLTEYASFTCPHCASFHANQYQQLKADYIDTGKVRFVFRDVYFDRFGLWAAMVARCEPNRFFGVTDMLFKQQKQWLGSDSPAGIADNLRRIGRAAGLTDEQVEGCLADQDNARALVEWYEGNQKADDITATPTLLIDGEKYSNMGYDELKKLIDEKLEG